ncbi:hypothetical protein ACFZCU_21310 [Streptomyces canus]|uniref:hypothetical protein n=1 Tax=Streptomyces canus TaxID=58343 RepID=UPI0036E36B5B
MLDPPDRFAAVALINGDADPLVAPRGRLPSALTVTVEGGRITSHDVVAEPAARPRRVEPGVLDPPGRFAHLALIDGDIGPVAAPRGRLPSALTVTVEGGRITSHDVAAEPAARPRRVEPGVLDPPDRFSSPSVTR